MLPTPMNAGALRSFLCQKLYTFGASVSFDTVFCGDNSNIPSSPASSNAVQVPPYSSASPGKVIPFAVEHRFFIYFVLWVVHWKSD